jgi:hypothetical protein
MLISMELALITATKQACSLHETTGIRTSICKGPIIACGFMTDPVHCSPGLGMHMESSFLGGIFMACATEIVVSNRFTRLLKV